MEKKALSEPMIQRGFHSLWDPTVERFRLQSGKAKGKAGEVKQRPVLVYGLCDVEHRQLTHGLPGLNRQS